MAAFIIQSPTPSSFIVDTLGKNGIRLAKLAKGKRVPEGLLQDGDFCTVKEVGLAWIS